MVASKFVRLLTRSTFFCRKVRVFLNWRVMSFYKSHKIKSALLCGALLATGVAILKRSPAQNQNRPLSSASALAPRLAAAPASLPIRELKGRTPRIGAPDYPPAVAREFRAAWVATVANMDWPSRPGLPVAQQKAEILRILNFARDLNLNALVWQVRPMADAFYRSPYEPWSHYLSGASGRDPGYDPLEFVVQEAHARNIEIHAWFNPYRAGVSAKTDYSATHISRTNPDLVRRYGKSLWMDPGDKRVRERTVRVVRDVVKRYGIDGVHLDDYFYPYAERDAAGKIIPFPDQNTYGKYVQDGGRLSLGDWRRDNVNTLVRELSVAIKSEKSWVLFGVSPFGIWRPGNPRGIQGMDPYLEIYADARLWWHEGWVDYLAPQLYWKIAPPAQSYPALLNWWADENRHNRHLWPGHFAQKVESRAFSSQEIVDQIALTRARPDSSGDILFSMRTLLSNPDQLSDKLKKFYVSPALVPASPWLGPKAPGAPIFGGTLDAPRRALRLRWKPRDGDEVIAHWTVQMRYGASWTTKIFAGDRDGSNVWIDPNRLPDLVALTAVDRVGNQSAPVLLELS